MIKVILHLNNVNFIIEIYIIKFIIWDINSLSQKEIRFYYPHFTDSTGIIQYY